MQIHIRIYGRVQGVGFRAWAVCQALDLHLVGFVRNRRDGSVELVAHGASDALSILLQKCHSVDKVEPMAYPDAPMPQISQTFVSCHTV